MTAYILLPGNLLLLFLSNFVSDPPPIPKTLSEKEIPAWTLAMRGNKTADMNVGRAIRNSAIRQIKISLDTTALLIPDCHQSCISNDPDGAQNTE